MHCEIRPLPRLSSDVHICLLIVNLGSAEHGQLLGSSSLAFVISWILTMRIGLVLVALAASMVSWTRMGSSMVASVESIPLVALVAISGHCVLASLGRIICFLNSCTRVGSLNYMWKVAFTEVLSQRRWLVVPREKNNLCLSLCNQLYVLVLFCFISFLILYA